MIRRSMHGTQKTKHERHQIRDTRDRGHKTREPRKTRDTRFETQETWHNSRDHTISIMNISWIGHFKFYTQRRIFYMSDELFMRQNRQRHIFDIRVTVSYHVRPSLTLTTHPKLTTLMGILSDTSLGESGSNFHRRAPRLLHARWPYRSTIS